MQSSMTAKRQTETFNGLKVHGIFLSQTWRRDEREESSFHRQHKGLSVGHVNVVT
jgi:hypothetical protein